MSTESPPKPDRLALGQRWAFNESTWEIEEMDSTTAMLREIEKSGRRGRRRGVDRESFYRRYTYVGEFAVPKGYVIHKIEMGPGGHCYRTPAGNVHGGQPGTRWSWKQARDAAVADSRGLTTAPAAAS